MLPVLFTVPGVFLKVFVLATWLWFCVLGLVRLRAKFRQAQPPPEEHANELPPRPFWQQLRHAASASIVAIALFLSVSPARADIQDGALSERLGPLPGLFFRFVTQSSTWTADWLSLPVYAYGVMLGSSLLLGWYLTLGLAERQGLPRARAQDCYVFTALCAIVGARFLYVVTNLHEFRDPDTGSFVVQATFALRTGGLVAYGGFLGGLLGSVAYLRFHSLSFWRWADAAAPSLASGLALTRVGCYLFGCDFGKPLSPESPPWLRQLGSFPHWPNELGSPAWQQHVRHGFASTQALCLEIFHGDLREATGLCHLDPLSSVSAPVHPTQLYEALVGAGLFALLARLWRSRRFEGQVLLSFALLYGLARSGIELLRDDLERGVFRGLSTSQWLGLSTAALCLGLYVWRAKHAPRAEGLEFRALFAPREPHQASIEDA